MTIKLVSATFDQGKTFEKVSPSGPTVSQVTALVDVARCSAFDTICSILIRPPTLEFPDLVAVRSFPGSPSRRAPSHAQESSLRRADITIHTENSVAQNRPFSHRSRLLVHLTLSA